MSPSSWSRSPSSKMLVLRAVVQLNHAIFKSFDGLQLQGHVTITTSYQGDTLPNKHRGHTDDELVDRLRVQKGGDDLAAAHQPDILAGLLSKPAHEWADCIVYKLHAGRGVRWWVMTREDDGTIFGIELCSQAQTRFVGLPAE